MPLAPMVFAGGSLSEYRSPGFKRFLGFGPSRSDLSFHLIGASNRGGVFSFIAIGPSSRWSSLERHAAVSFAPGQQRPGHTGIVIGQGHGGHVWMAPLEQPRQPRVAGWSSGGRSRSQVTHNGPSAVDQQRPEVTIAAFADSQQSLATA